ALQIGPIQPISHASAGERKSMTQKEAVMGVHYVARTKDRPSRTFKSPMDVLEANIDPVEKLTILKAWEADERALLRAESKEWREASMRIFTRCKRRSTI